MITGSCEGDLRIAWQAYGGNWFKERDVWFRHTKSDRLSDSDARSAVETTLSQGFVDTTLTLMDPSSFPTASETEVQLIQMGQKCNVFLVTAVTPADLKYQFVLMQSKGNDRLNKALVDDFRDLQELRTALVRKGVSTFVPEPFVLGEGNGTPAFSFQFLPDHEEVNPSLEMLMAVNGAPYCHLVANSDSPSAEAFNQEMYRKIIGLPGFVYPRPEINEEVFRSSPYYQITERLKAQMIARLYVTHKLLGKLPREFSIAAGDFMARFDVDVDNFDLQLITIRGGWEGVSRDGFKDWIRNRSEILRTDFTDKQGRKVPLFSDGETIDLAIEQGRGLFN